MGIRDNKIPSRGTRIISESRGVLSLMGFFCSHFLRWRRGKCPNKLRNFIKYPCLSQQAVHIHHIGNSFTFGIHSMDFLSMKGSLA